MAHIHPETGADRAKCGQYTFIDIIYCRMIIKSVIRLITIKLPSYGQFPNGGGGAGKWVIMERLYFVAISIVSGYAGQRNLFSLGIFGYLK